MGALLVHTLLVASLVLSLSLPSPRSSVNTGAGASPLVSAAEPEMTIVFIDEPSPVQNVDPPTPPALASRGTTPPDLQLAILSPDPSPAVANQNAADTDGTTPDTATADAAEHARLYGRYVGQVQARIERAWMRPRTEIGASRFSCRARIQQGRPGTVVDVTLDHCNGSSRWQQSLISAIRTASPLPAPPDVSVYADVLWLSFVSEGFEQGGATQGFEPENRLADSADRGVLESSRKFANAGDGELKLDNRDATDVIHLTIIGNPSAHSVSNQLPAEPPTAPQPLEPQPSDLRPQ